MAELENERGQEKVPVTSAKAQQKVEQELSEKAPEPREQWETPRRWRTY